jgi:predicted NBD/HSP70 family sugar kinase
MRVLVLDVGGTNVKIRHSHQNETRRFPSGKTLTPKQFVSRARRLTSDWKYDVVSIGIPTPVKNGKAAIEPKNLGKGWKNVDLSKSFQQPVKVVNDAALQALGSYRGGRMLFLGLGTGLGSSLVVENLVVPLELGQLNRTKRKSWEDFVADEAFLEVGIARWRKDVFAMLDVFRQAFLPDYIVVGGGNAKELGDLPRGVERGDNRNALAGGIRLWERTAQKSAGPYTWTVV